ncbi:hypothetical protein [Bradyrhizobium sp. AUGA SZCCT0160]|uniref:hypothetical protein n=1 Tax=Bradyrhizobium sp. AUGA SZCCT0160 TaxID=2807662 RepID=UPI001BAADCDC|nr:hypothetical protein [Bradyrhizobium sp. AUGA SZCCT0160]MBR1187306.1 hypothetical protein [Bradyrhizobium sp. AUGA SZCCT0160]
METRKKQPAKKRRGPAPQGDYAGKAKTINTRVTPDLRGWLEKAARKSGRSLSQEIETRLRRTFREEDDLAKQFGTADAARVFQTIALTLNMIRNPENPEADWLHDPYAFAFAVDAIHQTLYLVRPKEATDPFLAYGLEGTVNPSRVAREVWRDIANSDPTLPLTNDLTFYQWLARKTKNTIPEIVERAGERANKSESEPRLEDDPPTNEEQIAMEQIMFPQRGKK